MHQVEAQVYEPIETQIATARHSTETAIANATAKVKQLAALRKTLEGILRDVQAQWLSV